MTSDSHVFPGAVLEEDHDGTLAIVDKGMIPGPCPDCGFEHLHQLIEPDEKPDGMWLGYDVVACCSCGYESDNVEGQ